MKINPKWYEGNLGIITLLVIFFPVGLYLMWKHASWKPKVKWFVTGFIAFLLVVGNANGNGSKPNPEANTQTVTQLEKAPTATPTPSETAQLAQADQSSIENKPTESNSETYLVTRVIDGDTIEIQGGQRVRYIGIDTPETVDPNRPVGCYGQEASDKNKTLVLNKQVKLEKDVSETDKYGRLLRYVYVDDMMVNDYLVRQGYANASSYPPDVKYQEQFRQAQQEAVANNRGLWGSCQSNQTTIKATPTTQTSTQTTQDTGSCTIKGNINSEGEKIYHVPGCQSYAKTQIDTSAGERWFCSESEAIQAGWRKAKNCP